MNIDVLIIGQGLAGTLLADQLEQNKSSVLLIQDPELSSSSRVAGGMINPVTGKHLAKTWKADEIFPFLKSYYRQKEEELKTRFFYEIPLYRPFKNEQQKHQFTLAIKKHGLEEWCSSLDTPKYPNDLIMNHLGGIETFQTGRLDVAAFLNRMAEKWEEEGKISYENFDYSRLIIGEKALYYRDIKARYVVFAEGFHQKDNPYFNWLPLNPVKGETLDIRIPEVQLSEIINQGIWIMPVGNDTYKLGATYSWHELNNQTTEEAREYLLQKAKLLISKEIEVIDQSAGVRPASNDRRPILGPHPEHRNLFLFNGLGTKGVSLGPYFARELSEHILSGKELNPETTITRFYPLY